MESRQKPLPGQEKKKSGVNSTSYRYIDTSDELARIVDRISQEQIIAVDLEADSMFHYREKVCLLQMAVDGENVVIDPLMVEDLSPLAPLFNDESIMKVFHGSDYDVRSLYRDFSFEINNLFDTQVASMFLGERETSLEAVVGKRFGFRLDKRYRKRDWSQRPLPESMIDYAASDVIHLIPLARLTMEELSQKNRLNWVKEECQYLSAVRPVENGDDPLFLRFRGAGRLPRRNLAALEGLLQYRRHLARKMDRPLFKVFSNTALLKIATQMAMTQQALEAVRCMSAKQIRIHGTSLTTIVKKANTMANTDLPFYPRKRRPSLPPKVPKRIKAIKSWRDDLAKHMDLDPSLLLNKALMTAIAVNMPTDLVTLRKIEGIRKWQVEALGEGVLEVLSTHKDG